MLPGDSEAFAVSDHQIAHIYVKDISRIDLVAKALQSIPGVARIARPIELELNHPRSGELIALSEPDAWFTYYYWLDNQFAPDFAKTVDIHRKPGYDPCELFMTSRFKAISRLAQKKAGLRYKMDVIPLNAELVRGSHGLQNQPEEGPLIVGPGELPSDMKEFHAYCRGLLNS